MSRQLTLDFFLKQQKKPSEQASRNARSLAPMPTSTTITEENTENKGPQNTDVSSARFSKFHSSIPQTQTLIDEPVMRRFGPIGSQTGAMPNSFGIGSSASASPRQCNYHTSGDSPRSDHVSTRTSASCSPSVKSGTPGVRRIATLSDDSDYEEGGSGQGKSSSSTGFSRQYLSIRSKLDNETVLYIRKGRFFELYEKDSAFANATMGLKLTRHASAMSMCGVPDYMLDKYLKQTLDLGKRAAVADEFPEMDKTEKVQKRQVTAIYSPGSVSTALLLGNNYGILYLESTDADAPSNILQLYDPLRRLVLTEPSSRTLEEVINWILRLSPAEIIINSDRFELIAAHISTYFLGPIYRFTDFYSEVVGSGVVWNIAVDLLDSYPGVSRNFSYYLGYLLATDKRLKAIQQRNLDDYIESITIGNMFCSSQNLSPIVTVPGLTLSSLNIFPLCAADSFARFEAVDASVFEVYNNCATSDGSQMLRTWLMNPLYDIATIQLRQSAAKMLAEISNHVHVEALLSSLKSIGTNLYYQVLGCRAGSHFSTTGTLEHSVISTKLFVRLLVTILKTYSAATALCNLLEHNKQKVQDNEMLSSFAFPNDCWNFLEVLTSQIMSKFEMDTVQNMLRKEFKLSANSREPSLIIADALLEVIEQRYVRYLNELAQRHRLSSSIRGYPLATLGPASSNSKTYTIGPFPDRHLVIGDSIIPLNQQLHFAQKEGITQVSTTKVAGRFAILDPLPNETIAAANRATETAESQSNYNEQALCKLLRVDFKAFSSFTDVKDKTRFLTEALFNIDFRQLLLVESFLLRRKNSVLNTLKLELLVFLFENEQTLREICSIFAQMDVLCCFSKLSRIYTHVSWTYPILQPPLDNDEHIIDIRSAFHPITLKLGQARLQKWVPLDCSFKDHKLLILTGCNMSGKSTAMRLVGIAVLLAQIGAPVPCSGMFLTPYSAILAKVGNEEDVRSTFQKETADCASLLQEAMKPGSRTLFILDEFGRGTDSSTGDALAEAVCRKLLSLNLRAIISTHSPLMALKLEQEEYVRLCHMDFEITPSGIRFNHVLRDGLCTRSFGTQIARLAGFPDALIEQCDNHTYEFIYSSILSTIQVVNDILKEG